MMALFLFLYSEERPEARLYKIFKKECGEKKKRWLVFHMFTPGIKLCTQMHLHHVIESDLPLHMQINIHIIFACIKYFYFNNQMQQLKISGQMSEGQIQHKRSKEEIELQQDLLLKNQMSHHSDLMAS